MKRQLSYTIEEADAGKSVGEFLKDRAYSRGVCIALKKVPEGIIKDGKPVTVREIVHTGDILTICLVEPEMPSDIAPTQSVLEVLYEDEDLLILNKPYDTPIHPSVNNYGNTVANSVMYHYKKQGIDGVFRCINRLDRDTTGATIVAKNLLSASILAKQLTHREVKRTYIAFVEGVTQEKGCINLPIGRMQDSILKRQIDALDGKEAVTYYHRLAVLEIEGAAISVVALRLETGRTHQIRVHMTAIGHPLLGDFLYNEENKQLTRQGLHAMEIAFYHPITHAYIRSIAPIPKDMEQLLTQNSAVKIVDLLERLAAIRWEEK